MVMRMLGASWWRPTYLSKTADATAISVCAVGGVNCGASCASSGDCESRRCRPMSSGPAGTPAGPDDIGRHLLDSQSPLLAHEAPQLTPPTAHTEIAVASAVFDKYVGRHQLAPSILMTISRDGEHFFSYGR